MAEKTLTPTFDLIGNAFNIFTDSKNIGFIVKFTIVQILLMVPIFLIFFLVFGLSSFAVGGNTQDLPPVFFIVLAPLFYLAFGVLASWLGSSSIVAINSVADGKTIGIKESFKLGWGKTLKYFGVWFLMSLIVAAGFLLFVIPGFIFAIWFSFAIYLVVMENKGVINSLKASKFLVSGYFFSILFRFIVYGLLGIVVVFVFMFVPVLGPLLSIFITPFFLLLNVLLIKDLIRVKGSLGPAQ